MIRIARSDLPFLKPAMFRNRNFTTGLVVIFNIGINLLTRRGLLMPMLSRIFGYPTITIGVVMGPRGAGTMASMVIVGLMIPGLVLAAPACIS